MNSFCNTVFVIVMQIKLVVVVVVVIILYPTDAREIICNYNLKIFPKEGISFYSE